MAQAAFILPKIEENLDGWGPTDSSLDKFKHIPHYYSPYNKGDKLGKVADWQSQQSYGKNRYQARDQGSHAQQTSTIFTYSYQEDDSSFTTVDSSKVTSARKGFKSRIATRGLARSGPARGGAYPSGARRTTRGRPSRGGASGRGRSWGTGAESAPARKRDYSVEIREDWQSKEVFEFSALNKLEEIPEPQGTELTSSGEVKLYDATYDRLTVTANRALQKTNAKFVNLSTSDDPIIRRLSLKSQGTAVYGTDLLFAHLMACTRSVIPWDIVINKVGSAIFFDFREDSNFDTLSVNENAADPPTEDQKTYINSLSALSKEATLINQSFSQQVLKPEGIKLAEPLEIETHGEELAHIGYRYKKWDLGDGITLVARCELDAAAKVDNVNKFYSVKALNEYDPKITGDWRKRIEVQRGAVLVTEAKNNSFKLAQWTIQSLLAGTDSLKLGFVSRFSPRDYEHHAILAVQDYDPKEFANQISLNIKQLWAVLRHIISKCMKLETGKYVLLRDNEKNVLRLYAVPEDAFDEEEEKA